MAAEASSHLSSMPFCPLFQEESLNVALESIATRMDSWFKDL